MKKIFVLVYLSLPLFVAGELNHDLMFKSYLSGDLTYWGDTFENELKNELSFSALHEIVNYEYGYIAWCLGQKKKSEAEICLTRFGQHIDRLEMLGESPSIVAVYRSAFYAYSIGFNKWKIASYAAKAVNFANDAVALDSNNPLALTLKGNVEFYSPAMFGGSKKRALEYFRQSISNYESRSIVKNNWNYIATMLCYAQAYEKIGNKNSAIEVCKKILECTPDFVFVRDVYYPQLVK